MFNTFCGLVTTACMIQMLLYLSSITIKYLFNVSFDKNCDTQLLPVTQKVISVGNTNTPLFLKENLLCTLHNKYLK